MASKAEAILEAALSPGGDLNRRSLEYKYGVIAALLNAENVDTIGYKRKQNPYRQGVAASDAWLAGVVEGKRLWRINTGVEVG